MQQKCHEYVKDKDLDMLFITETWLRPGDDKVIADLCPEGYHYSGKPRLSGKGGGVGVVYKASLPLH